MHNTIVTAKQQKGSSLIEVLIGILILTVGILGMAAMQLSAKKLGYDSLQRAIAISMAHDIAERIRSNNTVVGSYAGIDFGNGALDKPGTACDETPCSAGELAAFDLWEWDQSLIGVSELTQGEPSGGLVNPRACITNVNGLVTIAIAWKSFRSGGSPAASPCGTGQGLYGINDEERQLIFFTTFVRDEGVPL